MLCSYCGRTVVGYPRYTIHKHHVCAECFRESLRPGTRVPTHNHQELARLALYLGAKPSQNAATKLS